MRRFIRSESGAVTIDWVVLTAATVGMSLAVMSVVSDGIEDLADRISTQISDIQLRDSFDEWAAFRAENAAEAAAAAQAEADAEGQDGG